MIWLTWRQHRGEAYITGGVLALLAILLIISGREMARGFQQWGVGACLLHRGQPSCNAVVDTFQERFTLIINAVVFLNVIPVLLAMLVGAPLVARELEYGTYRLVWTQSITRFRWVAVKLIVIVGAALLTAVALASLLAWWFGPLHQFGGFYFPLTFDLEGTVPLAYMAFALSLAVAAGAVVRRTVPAMALTVGAFLAVRLPIEFWLRPHYLPPLTAVEDLALTSSQVKQADWVLDRTWVDHLGHPVPVNEVITSCQGSGNAFLQCIHAHGWLLATTYQPADRLALFAQIESVIFAALAVVLVALAIWWVSRRIA
jgi:hypothetical protein